MSFSSILHSQSVDIFLIAHLPLYFYRKIHTSCRDYCCRKKKFNRSIDPSVQNAVAATFRQKATTSSSSDKFATNGEGKATSPSMSSPSPVQVSQPVERQSSARRRCEGSTVNVRMTQHKQKIVITIVKRRCSSHGYRKH